MTPLASMRQVIVLLSSRATRVRLQLHKDKATVDGLRAQIDRLKEDIEQRKAQARERTYQGQYRRETLLRARGQKAVILYAIVQREIELADLLEQVQGAQRQLDETRQRLMALERRHERHRVRLARERAQRQWRQETQAVNDYLEGASRHGFNQR